MEALTFRRFKNSFLQFMAPIKIASNLFFLFAVLSCTQKKMPDALRCASLYESLDNIARVREEKATEYIAQLISLLDDSVWNIRN